MNDNNNESTSKTRPHNNQPRDLPTRTFDFAIRVVKLCAVLDQSPGVARNLSRQLLRSGTSIGANVEEGQGSQSRADFAAKYAIACKEARETLYWLRLLVASGILPPSRLEALIKETHELVAILTTIVKKTRISKDTNPRRTPP